MGNAQRRYLQLGLLFATLLVVLLSVQVRSLRTRLAQAIDRSETLPVGTLAPVFTGSSLEGDRVLMGRTSDARAQLYLVYSTGCPYCRRSIEAWNELAGHFKEDDRVRVVGISVDSLDRTSDYHRDNQLAFRTVLLPDRRTRDVHRLGAVPQTIVLDPDGRVEYARIGLLEHGSALDSVLSAVNALIRSDQVESTERALTRLNGR